MNQKAVWVTCSISLAAMMMIAPNARAEDVKGRDPIKPVVEEGTRPPLVEGNLRTTQLRLDRYNVVERIVRIRHEGKTLASFSAEPMLIAKGGVVLFEISSSSAKGSVSRWRCVAKSDVAECLGAPVKVKYLEGEDKMILTATLKPAHEMGVDEAGVASR